MLALVSVAIDNKTGVDEVMTIDPEISTHSSYIYIYMCVLCVCV
jgi:hypothetical protein